MEFEIPVVEKLKVKIGGTSYDCRPFTMKDVRGIRSLQDLLNANDAEKASEGIDKMIELISEFGIPKDVLESLPPQSFNSLVEYLVGAEKK